MTAFALKSWAQPPASSPAFADLDADGYEGIADNVARLARFEWEDGEASPNGDVLATVPIPGGAVQVLPSDAFDAGAAEQRIAARREELQKEIEERKRAQAKVDQLNRVYAVLSGINSLIVRVGSRDELCNESCRLAVEHGRFRVAWIGMLDAAAGLISQGRERISEDRAWESCATGARGSDRRKIDRFQQ